MILDPDGVRTDNSAETPYRLLFGPTDECTIGTGGINGLFFKDPNGFFFSNPAQGATAKVTVEGIKAQQDEIETLREEKADLERRLARLEFLVLQQNPNKQ